MKHLWSNSVPALAILVLLPLGVVLGPLTASAAAQSQADLRRENQRLRTQIEDLDRELEALRAELQRIRQENEDLRRRLAAGGPSASTSASGGATPPPPPPPQVTIDESRPDASPRALLRALQSGYAEAMNGTELGDSTGSAARVGYLRKLDRWASRVNRDHKTSVEWHVEVISLPVAVGRGFTLRLQAVDPETAVTLGDPFDAFLARTVFNRLRQIEQRGGLDEVLVLKGVLTPRVHVNEDRTSAGPFDNPRFIGVFAEFGFTVDVTNLLSGREAKPRPERD